MKKTRPLLIVTLAACLLAAGAIWMRGFLLPPRFKANPGPGGLEMVNENYGSAIHDAAKEFDLPEAYLKALCMLECSGRSDPAPRFEKYVYTRLKMVQAGLKDSFEHVKSFHLRSAGDEAIQNLSSSWGPFQLMGYKCMLLGIRVKDIRGEEAAYYGVKWIDLTYGKLLRQGRFRDCFHMHNTGSLYPKNGKVKTYDPNYVKNGLKYMKYYGYHFQ